MLNKIFNEDCFSTLQKIGKGSVSLILTDPPYNTTSCSWDKEEINLTHLWELYSSVLKPEGTLVFTASQPFTTRLINSKIDWFKYTLVWNKVKPSSALLSRIQPLRSHEDIIVFSNGTGVYNPQMEKASYRSFSKQTYSNGDAFGGKEIERDFDNNELKFPKSILTFSNANQKGKIHPTQKPVDLFSYLIKTYSNEGDIVLDTFSGSGTTAIACLETKRNYICFEKEKEYYEASLKRIEDWHESKKTIMDLMGL